MTVNDGSEAGLGWMARAFNRIQMGLLMLSGVGIVAMMLLVTANVITRNLFNHQIRGSFQIVETYLMPLSIFLGFSYAYETEVMPRLAFLIDKASVRFRLAVHLLLSAIELIVVGILLIFAWQAATSAAAQRMLVTVGGELWPLSPVMFLAPAGFLLVVIQVLLCVAASIKAREPRFQASREKRAAKEGF